MYAAGLLLSLDVSNLSATNVRLLAQYINDTIKEEEEKYASAKVEPCTRKQKKVLALTKSCQQCQIAPLLFLFQCQHKQCKQMSRMCSQCVREHSPSHKDFRFLYIDELIVQQLKNKCSNVGIY